MNQKSCRLAAKNKCFLRLGVIQWLLAEPVTRQKNTLGAKIDDRECEHAVQPERQTIGPLPITMDKNFGI